MYIEGVADLIEMIMYLPMTPRDEKDAKITQIKDRTINRYLPAFEKVSALFSVFGALGIEKKGEECWAFLGQGPSLPVSPPGSWLMEHPDSQGIV